MSLSVTIVTPHQSIVNNLKCDDLVLPAAKGEITVLPGHTPVLTTLGVGRIETVSKNESIDFLVSYGFAEIRDNHVLILGEDIKPASALDTELAAKNKAELEQTGLNKILGEIEYANYLKKLEHVHKELEIAELFQKKKK